MKQQKQNLEDATRGLVYEIMDAHGVGYNTARDLLRRALLSNCIAEQISEQVDFLRGTGQFAEDN